MKIITISREFGSGGREIGKRLADILGFDYYDKEILNEISKKKKIDEKYLKYIVENQGWRNIPLNFGTSFMGTGMNSLEVATILEDEEVISEIAKIGNNFVIVGRNTDIILGKYNPFNIFVCADIDSKIKRCKEREKEGENLSEKEIKKMIKEIDKGRAKSRSFISDTEWGQRDLYHLTINTSGWNIEELTESLVSLIKKWYKE